jgi:Zinc-binding dehydrogenase
MTQLIVIIEILIAERDSKYPLANQSHDLVFNEVWTPQIVKAASESLHHADRSIRRTQQQRTGIRGDRAGVERGYHLPPFDGFKFEEIRGTVCGHRGAPRIIDKSFWHNNSDSSPRCTQFGERSALAKKLGATLYIDNKLANPVEELQKLGGAQVSTAPSSKAMSQLFDGLGPNGKLMVIGVTFDPLEIAPVQLISGSRTIQGWAAGTPADTEDTLRFAELTGVRPMIEKYPLEKAVCCAAAMSALAQKSATT